MNKEDLLREGMREFAKMSAEADRLESQKADLIERVLEELLGGDYRAGFVESKPDISVRTTGVKRSGAVLIDNVDECFADMYEIWANNTGNIKKVEREMNSLSYFYTREAIQLAQVRLSSMGRFSI